MYKKAFVLCSYLVLLGLVGCGLPRTIDDADEVKISYTLAFPDGEILDSGTANIIVGQPRDEIEAFQTLIVGARVDDVLSGTITPEEGYGYLHDFSLEQTLSEVYLPSTDSEYMVGNQIFLANVGSGVITNIGLKNGVTKYTVDFNAPETYNNLAYEIKILEVLKR